MIRSTSVLSSFRQSTYSPSFSSSLFSTLYRYTPCYFLRQAILSFFASYKGFFPTWQFHIQLLNVCFSPRDSNLFTASFYAILYNDSHHFIHRIMIQLICTLLGAYTLFGTLFTAAQWGYYTFVAKCIDLQARYGKGSWALITGSSDGIGKQIAIAFAKRGFNIVIAARTLSKLQALQQFIEKECHVSVKCIPIDLNSQLAHQVIQQQTAGLDIAVLVNNVGVDVLDFYRDIPLQTTIDLINLNCLLLMSLSRLFIDRFAKRQRSLLVNVGSVAGEMAIPLHNVYSASKGYVNRLTACLSQELTNVDVMVLNPSEVSTEMTCMKPEDIMTISAKKCAEGLMQDVGRTNLTNGHWQHKAQSWLYGLVPEFIFNQIWMKFVAPKFIAERKAYRKAV